MAFNPSDDFREAWTARTVLQARRSLLAYNLGNNSSEPLIRSNYKYHVANPSISLTGRTRDRNASTGALAEMLNSLADFFDEEVETNLVRFITLIEPALLVTMGIVIAALLLALYMPLLQLSSVIG